MTYRNPIILVIGLALAMAMGTGCSTSNQRAIPATPTMTVFCLQGSLMKTDLGSEGSTHGDLTTWWANVYSSMPTSKNPKDTTLVGIASGFMITTGPSKDLGDKDGFEFRVSNFTLKLLDSNDSIVCSGIHRYEEAVGQLTNQVQRPITGGTGQFLGRAGEAIVTAEGDDWFRVDLYLLD